VSFVRADGNDRGMCFSHMIRIYYE
jgi:hypothetical protein